MKIVTKECKLGRGWQQEITVIVDTLNEINGYKHKYIVVTRYICAERDSVTDYAPMTAFKFRAFKSEREAYNVIESYLEANNYVYRKE